VGRLERQLSSRDAQPVASRHESYGLEGQHFGEHVVVAVEVCRTGPRFGSLTELALLSPKSEQSE
jgi:hypothetical protein